MNTIWKKEFTIFDKTISKILSLSRMNYKTDLKNYDRHGIPQ